MLRVLLFALLAPAACNAGRPLPSLAEVPVALAAPTVLPMTHLSRPIVKVRLDGSEGVPFLVDTGASHTLIGLDTAVELGMQIATHPGTTTVEGSSSHSVAADDYAYVTSLRAGELEARGFYITALDDDVMGMHGFVGILGQDLLSRLVAVFDMERRELHWLPSGTGHEEIAGYLRESRIGDGAWISLKLRYDGRPFLPLTVADIEDDALEMLVDTGADSSSLPTAVVDTLGVEPSGTGMYQGVGGYYEGREFLLEDFHMFGFQLSFECHETQQDHGVLGMDLLREFVFLLDGPGERCWLHHRSVAPNTTGMDEGPR